MKGRQTMTNRCRSNAGCPLQYFCLKRTDGYEIKSIRHILKNSTAGLEKFVTTVIYSGEAEPMFHPKQM